MRMHKSQKVGRKFFMTKSSIEKTLPLGKRFCYTTWDFTFSRGSWKFVGLNHSLCAPSSHMVMWLLSILRVIQNSKWMGKDLSHFWPLSLRHRLKLCWVFRSVIHLIIAIHTATKKKNPYCLYAYPLYLFCLTFLSSLRTWPARVYEGGNLFSSPYLLRFHLHEIHWGQCIR